MTEQSNKTHNKIYTLEQLASKLESERSSGKRITQCHGVFDLLHIGHIRHFEQAKKFGDILVVTVTPDEYVNKGPHRPAFSQDFRIEAIAALECVNYVAVTRSPAAVDAILTLKPDIYAKGAEYSNRDQDITGQIVHEENAVLSVGGKLGFTDDAVVFSSTNLINRHMPIYPKEVQDHLAYLSDNYTIEGVLSYLENARNLKVLVLGEAIIDDYHYAETDEGDDDGHEQHQPRHLVEQVSKALNGRFGDLLQVVLRLCDTGNIHEDAAHPRSCMLNNSEKVLERK